MFLFSSNVVVRVFETVLILFSGAVQLMSHVDAPFCTGPVPSRYLGNFCRYRWF